LLQKNYGWVGIKAVNGSKSIVMTNAQTGKPVEIVSVPLSQSVVFLRAVCDFNNRADKGFFYYSLDGKSWTAIGTPLKMAYTIPHFMGYRFGLFNYATREAGGYVDFDFFRVSDKITQ
jgi:beta-xylosidase